MGPRHGVGAAEALLAEVLYGIHTLIWQWGGDDSAPRPERVVLPGMEPPPSEQAMSIDEMNERLKPYLPRQE
jgi:hypothetical protein